MHQLRSGFAIQHLHVNRQSASPAIPDRPRRPERCAHRGAHVLENRQLRRERRGVPRVPLGDRARMFDCCASLRVFKSCPTRIPVDAPAPAAPPGSAGR